MDAYIKEIAHNWDDYVWACICVFSTLMHEAIWIFPRLILTLCFQALKCQDIPSRSYFLVLLNYVLFCTWKLVNIMNHLHHNYSLRNLIHRFNSNFCLQILTMLLVVTSWVGVPHHMGPTCMQVGCYYIQ